MCNFLGKGASTLKKTMRIASKCKKPTNKKKQTKKEKKKNYKNKENPFKRKVSKIGNHALMSVVSIRQQ